MSSPSKGLQITIGGMPLSIASNKTDATIFSCCAVPMPLGLHPFFYPATLSSTACVLIIMVSEWEVICSSVGMRKCTGICFFVPCVCRELV